MSALDGKRVLLGVTGGIAAYKSALLARRLRERGAEVQVVMTPVAGRFITPLTLQAVTGREVRSGLFDEAAEAAMGHIELARWADLVLVAPASADFMARLAAGMADDLLTTLCLASDRPIALAPSMNRLMWANPATENNSRTLTTRGVALWGPGDGSQACGEFGQGRMLEPEEIVERAEHLFAGDGLLAGLDVLITAGPTREPIDPVRYVTNRSSGKMGYAVAAACVQAGARVTLVSGPVSLAPPAGVEFIAVETAAEMFDAVIALAQRTDIFIACAAVADYRPAEVSGEKIKKAQADLSLPLERTDDILATVATRLPDIFTVGFAAETRDLQHYAEQKRRKKALDMVAANWVGTGRGFDADDNSLWVCWEGGSETLPRAPKSVLARNLVRLIAQRYGHEEPVPNPNLEPDEPPSFE